MNDKDLAKQLVKIAEELVAAPASESLQQAVSAAGDVLKAATEAAELDREAKQILAGLQRAMTHVYVGIRDVEDSKVNDRLMKLWNAANTDLHGRDASAALKTVGTLVGELKKAQKSAKSSEQDTEIWDRHNKR